MIKDLWLNLPVKNVKRSKEFFTKLGFQFNLQNGDTDHSACLLVGEKNSVVMLFEEIVFSSFIKSNITDANSGAEVLLSISLGSKEEVNKMAQNVKLAGGNVFSEPGGEGWLYGMAFSDLDGHRWNVLFMDMSKRK